MNPIGLVLLILYWIFPALFVVWILVVALAGLVETIRKNGLPETILSGLGLLTFVFAASAIVKIIIFPLL